jgi:hypothetical protein
VTAAFGVYAMTVVGSAFPAFFRRILGPPPSEDSK